jgi:hypothetical protein
MSATFVGHATISAVSPSGDTVTITGYGAVFLDNVPVQHVSRLTDHIGTSGRTAAIQWDDDHFELSVTFRPAKAGARHDLATYPLIYPKGSILSLSGFHPIREDGATPPEFLNATDWIIVGDSTVTLTTTGSAEVQLQLKRYPGSPGLMTPIP